MRKNVYRDLGTLGTKCYVTYTYDWALEERVAHTKVHEPFSGSIESVIAFLEECKAATNKYAAIEYEFGGVMGGAEYFLTWIEPIPSEILASKIVTQSKQRARSRIRNLATKATELGNTANWLAGDGMIDAANEVRKVIEGVIEKKQAAEKRYESKFGAKP